MDAGGRATQEAKAENTENNKLKYVGVIKTPCSPWFKVEFNPLGRCSDESWKFRVQLI